MRNEKAEELRRLKIAFNRKVSVERRMKTMGRITSRIISALAKHLIKDAGYSVAMIILQREIRNIGREDAKDFVKLFGLKRGDKKDASKALKIAALFLGLELDALGNETIVKNCPQGMEAIKLREPILCNACLEYNNGILEEMLGDSYTLERTKWVFEGDRYCMFRIKRK